MQEKILVVDDDVSIASGFKKILSDVGFNVDMAFDEPRALSFFEKESYPVVLLDIFLNTSDGVQLIEKIRQKSEQTSIIMVTGYPSVDTAVKSFRKGAFEYLEKPCDRNTLLDAIDRGIKHFRSANLSLKEISGNTVIDSAAILHEIRAGLNLLSGYTELLSSTNLDLQQNKYLEGVKIGQEMLNDLSNNVLDLAKIESGVFSLEETDFNLELLINDINKLVMPSVNRKSLQFFSFLLDSVPRNVKGDPGRLRQVLINLINNAIKFTEAGNITLKISSNGFVNDSCIVKFQLSDTGIGIPSDKCREIFKPFVQVHNSKNNPKIKGTGLGLSICKLLVEKMGGAIGCQSELNKGSEFEFTIKFKKGKSLIEEEISPLRFQDIKNMCFSVLGIKEEFLDMMTDGFKKDNLNWLFFDSFERVLEHIFHKPAAGGPVLIPDIIFIDEDISQEEIIRSIKEIQEFSLKNKKIRLVLVTQERRIGLSKEAEDIGFDGFLPYSYIKDNIDFINFVRVLLGDKREAKTIMNRFLVNDLVFKGLAFLLAGFNQAEGIKIVQSLKYVGARADLVLNNVEALNMIDSKSYDFCLMNVDLFLIGRSLLAEGICIACKNKGFITGLLGPAGFKEAYSLPKEIIDVDVFLEQPFDMEMMRKMILRSIYKKN